MGVGKLKKQILDEVGVLYTEEEINEYKKQSNGVDLIEYIKSQQQDNSQKVINFLNSFENIDYMDWESEKTRQVISLIYTSELGYLNRVFREYLKSQGEDVHNIFMTTSKLFFNVVKEIKDNNLF